MGEQHPVAQNRGHTGAPKYVIELGASFFQIPKSQNLERICTSSVSTNVNREHEAKIKDCKTCEEVTCASEKGDMEVALVVHELVDSVLRDLDHVPNPEKKLVAQLRRAV